jgi:hypothetical protein
VMVPGHGRLLPCAQAILKVMSPPGYGELTQAVAAAASGELSADAAIGAILNLVCTPAPGVPDLRPGSTVAAGDRLGEVVHDTAGAGPVAWLALAAQQSGQRGPWEIYDTVRAKDRQTVTICSPGGRSVRASELLLRFSLPRHEPVTVHQPVPPPPPPPTPTATPTPRTERPAPSELGRTVSLLVGSNLIAVVAAAVLAGLVFGVGVAPEALLFVALGLACIAAVVFAPVIDARHGTSVLRPPSAVSARRRTTGYFVIAFMGLGCVAGWAVSVRADASVSGFSGSGDPSPASGNSQDEVPRDRERTVIQPSDDALSIDALADSLAGIWAVRDLTLKATRDSLREASELRDTAQAQLGRLADTLEAVRGTGQAAARQVTLLQATARRLEAERDAARDALERLRAAQPAPVRRRNRNR